MRVATVDIGTNTVLLLVAERRDDGSLVAVAERATITRLGEGVDQSRRLSDAAIARTNSCLDDYARIIRQLGVDKVAVVGTSAMRDASGGDAVRGHVRSTLGVDAIVVSGNEEARLTFRGALLGLPVGPESDVAVFDIGGGSTEVVFGRRDTPGPRLTYAASFDVGSVRLTERHIAHDPPTREELDAVDRAAREAFAGVPAHHGAPPIGIAGTVTTLVAVSLGLEPYDGARVHGSAMDIPDLRRVADKLAAVNLESRRRLPGMEPKRADVIVAGSRIALALLDHWSATGLVISDRGVRWGLAEELMAAD